MPTVLQRADTGAPSFRLAPRVGVRREFGEERVAHEERPDTWLRARTGIRRWTAPACAWASTESRSPRRPAAASRQTLTCPTASSLLCPSALERDDDFAVGVTGCL
jgi:hypothetical protein